MRKKIMLLAVALIAATGSYAQQKKQVNITFVLNAPGVPKDSTIYLTGNVPALGNWNPMGARMIYNGKDIWTKSILADSGQVIEYKYTRGSWEKEGASGTGAPLPNFKGRVTKNNTFVDQVQMWTGKKVIKGGITGTVKYHSAIPWAGIRSRDVIVWLPPGYEAGTAERYPVVYMHDGQNIIDPATSSFGVDWRVDESVDSLIRAKAIPPVIVVGIYNTADRMSEYMPGGLSESYIDFIIKGLKPMIDKEYRTKPDRMNTIVGGSSAGGVLALKMVWEHPDVFSKAICMSPAFKIDAYDYVKDVNAGKKKENVFFYIDNGGIELDQRLQPGVDAMLTALKAKGYKEGADFVFVRDPQAKHFEAAWAKRFPGALIQVLKSAKTR